MPKEKKGKMNNKRAAHERGDESRIRNYFVRLFGKYDFKNERQFNIFAKVLLYVLLASAQLQKNKSRHLEIMCKI